MPIFKVTVKEKITRYTAAYVEAVDKNAAAAWARTAPERIFAQEGEEDIWPEVSGVEPVDAAPDGAKVHTIKSAPTV